MNSELEDLRIRVGQLEVWAEGLGYQIPPTSPRSILCPRCGTRSFNPKDIEERYCANCQQAQQQKSD